MDGIINVYKECDHTSHDVVARLRGILHTKKIGHTGTLDPMAVGVLPVCVGQATKLCESITGHDKEYEARMILGKTYDTLDVTGTLLEEREVMSTEEEIRKAIDSFIGGYEQTPPMYSARKVNGKRLYDLAREGKTVERKSVFVDIYDITVLSVDIPYVDIRVKCGKGTYIRSLIDDIGKKLSCGAAMSALKRTAVGSFRIEEAHKLSEIEEMMKAGSVPALIALEDVFSDIGSFHPSGKALKLLLNGNCIYAKDAGVRPKDKERFRMYDDAGVFTGVYEYDGVKGILKPYKMFTGSSR